MCAEWSALPLLPLRCVLEHLNTEDALAAMSTCYHWRQAIKLYEGYRETLKLRAKQLEKSMFLTRLFKKNTKILHIYIDCKENEFKKFINNVLPQFYDTQLQELMFIGPRYIQQNKFAPNFKLNRIVTESLVFKHLTCMKKLTILGCEMSVVKTDHYTYPHKNIENYSRQLSFNSVESPADFVLSASNVNMMKLSSLQHIVMSYELLNTESLVTLSHLPKFSHLTMNILYKRGMKLTPINWDRVRPLYCNNFEISAMLVGVPPSMFNDVVEYVLVEGLPLISLKVLFCKFVHAPMLMTVAYRYKDCLRELVWADAPHLGQELLCNEGRVAYQFDTANSNTVNPFIILCWQCYNLRRLVIHGYWVWQYDLVGMVRLRKSLSRLEVSALRGQAAGGGGAAHTVPRLLAADRPPVPDTKYVHQINKYTEIEWSPIPWNKLHPGLRAFSTSEQKLDYIVQEAMQPLNVK